MKPTNTDLALASLKNTKKIVAPKQKENFLEDDKKRNSVSSRKNSERERISEKSSKNGKNDLNNGKGEGDDLSWQLYESLPPCKKCGRDTDVRSSSVQYL